MNDKNGKRIYVEDTIKLRNGTSTAIGSIDKGKYSIMLTEIKRWINMKNGGSVEIINTSN